jgi:hypothetical protein
VCAPARQKLGRESAWFRDKKAKRLGSLPIDVGKLVEGFVKEIGEPQISASRLLTARVTERAAKSFTAVCAF